MSRVDDQYFTFRSNGLLAFHGYAAGAGRRAGILWSDRRSARLAGIVVAALSAIVNLGFLAASPVWAVTTITLDIVVIYALTVHGWEIDER